MQIKLYKTDSEMNMINKELSSELVLSGTMKDSLDLINPGILVQFSDTSILSFNYAYIVELDRYYFINDRNIVNNKLVLLSMSLDPLMSFKSSIKNQYAILSRSENFWNLYLPDPEAKTQQNTNMYIKKWDKSFTPFKSFVMITLGSAQNLTSSSSSDSSSGSTDSGWSSAMP